MEVLSELRLRNEGRFLIVEVPSPFTSFKTTDLKQATLFVALTIGLLATCYYREVLGPTIVGVIVFFVSNLVLAGIYDLQLHSEERRSDG